jgi:hypothetical protein
MRNTNKHKTKYAPPMKSSLKPEIKEKSVIDSIKTQSASVLVKAVYYGLEERLLSNVTASIIEECIKDTSGDGFWPLPADDGERAIIFGDPIPNFHKKIFLRSQSLDGVSFSEIILSIGETCKFKYVDGVLSYS